MAILEETRKTPEKVDVQAQTFLCKNCGGVIKYDIGSEKFLCSSCRTEYAMEALSDSVKEYDFSQYAQREAQSVAFEGLAVAHCQNCGFEITFDEFEVATVCPMCASTQVATVKQSGGIPPEGIVPFKVDKDTARQKFKAWVKSRWFAPNDFKKKYGEGALSGMYLPFWTYDSQATAFYQGRGGIDRTEKDKEGNTRTVTDWTHVSGMVSSSFDDIQICASDKQKEIQGILPFNTVENTKPYTSSYLSGYHAEIYRVKADVGFESAKQIMEAELRGLAERDILRRFDRAQVHSLIPKYSNVTYKHVLLPVWGSSFGYKGKTYNYFVNGETGVVDGKRPYSPAKIIIAVAAALAVVLTALYFFQK